MRPDSRPNGRQAMRFKKNENFLIFLYLGEVGTYGPF